MLQYHGCPHLAVGRSVAWGLILGNRETGYVYSIGEAHREYVVTVHAAASTLTRRHVDDVLHGLTLLTVTLFNVNSRDGLWFTHPI